jgi:hypothetical protein
VDLTPPGEDQKRSDELLWDEAREFAIESFLAIEQRRQEALNREAGNLGAHCPECAELGHTDCYEAGCRAGLEAAARTAVELLQDGQRYMRWARDGHRSGVRPRSSFGTGDVVWAAEYLADQLADQAEKG